MAQERGVADGAGLVMVEGAGTVMRGGRVMDCSMYLSEDRVFVCGDELCASLHSTIQ